MKNRPLKYVRGTEGLTLVEVMVALSIFLIVIMGLFQTAILSIDNNMKNVLRDEAVTIAAMRMEELRSRPFAALVSDTSAMPSGVDCPSTFTIGERIRKNFRSVTKDVCITVSCQDLDGDGNCATDDAASNSKQINVIVAWKWKGEDYTHNVTTLRRR
jgi:prepilin-type N-terminal cleavage/methylation domain-containing protein